MKVLTKGLSLLCAVAFSVEAAQIGAPQAISAPPTAPVAETVAGGASIPVLSADGRYLAFVSRAPNLVTNPTSGKYQIFLRDLDNGDLTLLSVTAAGGGGNDHSMLPSLSSNGLWIAFESEAIDLVGGDTNEVSDIFVHDVAGGQTILVSGGNGAAHNPIISADGRYVAFESRASDLFAEDTNRAADVFVRDLVLDATTLVSINADGSGTANHGSELLTMTRVTVGLWRSEAMRRMFQSSRPTRWAKFTCAMCRLAPPIVSQKTSQATPVRGDSRRC